MNVGINYLSQKPLLAPTATEGGGSMAGRPRIELPPIDSATVERWAKMGVVWVANDSHCNVLTSSAWLPEGWERFDEEEGLEGREIYWVVDDNKRPRARICLETTFYEPKATVWMDEDM